MTISETSKYRYLTAPYCIGSGVDIGSAGDSVVPRAIQIDIKTPYCPLIGMGPIHLAGDKPHNITQWFRAGCLDFVYSSHLLEDFDADEQDVVLMEWMSCVKRGGHLIVLMPDKERWQRAVANGQPPNLAHKHEGTPGELTRRVQHNARYFTETWEVIMDECPDPNDYGIVFIAKKL